MKWRNFPIFLLLFFLIFLFIFLLIFLFLPKEREESIVKKIFCFISTLVSLLFLFFFCLVHTSAKMVQQYKMCCIVVGKQNVKTFPPSQYSVQKVSEPKCPEIKTNKNFFILFSFFFLLICSFKVLPYGTSKHVTNTYTVPWIHNFTWNLFVLKH